MATFLLRYKDLASRGIVRSRPHLARLINDHSFPSGFLLSPKARVWDEAEVTRWVQGRKEAEGRPTSAPRAAATKAPPKEPPRCTFASLADHLLGEGMGAALQEVERLEATAPQLGQLERFGVAITELLQRRAIVIVRSSTLERLWSLGLVDHQTRDAASGPSPKGAPKPRPQSGVSRPKTRPRVDLFEKPERLAFSVDEAAAMGGLSRRFIYAEMTRGALPFVKRGSRRLILREDLTAYLREARDATSASGA